MRSLTIPHYHGKIKLSMRFVNLYIKPLESSMSPAVEKICWIWENGTVKLKNQSDSSVLDANFRFLGLDIYGKTLTGKSSQKALKPAWNRHKLGGHLFCHTEMGSIDKIDTLKNKPFLFWFRIFRRINHWFSFLWQNKKQVQDKWLSKIRRLSCTCIIIFLWFVSKSQWFQIDFLSPIFLQQLSGTEAF